MDDAHESTFVIPLIARVWHLKQMLWGTSKFAAYLDRGRSCSPALVATTDKVPDNVEDYICHSQRRDIQGGDENAGAGAGPSGVPTRGPDDAMIEIEDLRTFDMWTNFVRIVSA